MNKLSTTTILLDIEGTTSSVSYVYDILFPFARKELPAYLDKHWGNERVKMACHYLAQDCGASGIREWMEEFEPDELKKRALEACLDFMDRDVKATGLKALQGMIWAEGYEAGKLQSHVYPDVVSALEAWKEAGLDLRIFSSGSIEAQRVFFKHTEYGDITPLFSEYYDTTTGPKREASSYRSISRECGVEPQQVTFLSDVVEELDAARDAGMQTLLVVRPGNKPISDANGHPTVETFDEIQFALPV